MNENLLNAIQVCIEGHSRYSREGARFRKWDGKTPYWVHPLWCAMTFLQETALPDSVNREHCFFALLFHDFLEDTDSVLPDWLPRESVGLVRCMTFSGEVGSTEIEIKLIWARPQIVRLLKLYDKVSNLLDGSWMSDEKWNGQYVPYVLQLAKDVEQNYGDLNIVRIARAVAIPRSVSNTQA